MLVVPDSVSLQNLGALVGTGGLFEGAKVGLFKNDFIPTRTTALADLTVADFTGYALSSAITWGTAYQDPTIGPVVLGSLKVFAAADPITNSNVIYGYYVVNAAGTALLWAERFAATRIVSAPGDAVPVLPAFGNVSQAGS
jgi:hypothetical protein